MAIVLSTAGSSSQSSLNKAWRNSSSAAAPQTGPPAYDISALNRISNRIRFARQETIFNEGDPAEHTCKVISGTVRLCKHMQDGRRQIADFMLPGDVFGLMQADEYSYTAEAVTDAIMLSYPNSQLERLGDSTPGLNKYLIAMLLKKLVNAREHLVVLGRNTARERVADFILRLAEREDLGDEERLDLPMGRQDVADHLGLTIETVCRVIAELKRRDIVAIPNQQQLLLKDLDALRGIAAGEA